MVDLWDPHSLLTRNIFGAAVTQHAFDNHDSDIGGEQKT